MRNIFKNSFSNDTNVIKIIIKEVYFYVDILFCEMK